MNTIKLLDKGKVAQSIEVDDNALGAIKRRLVETLVEELVSLGFNFDDAFNNTDELIEGVIDELVKE